MPDVIVTGLPRSGATVAAALIDYLPNSVCLNNPPIHIAYARQQRSVTPYCKWLVGDFAWQRAQLLRKEPIPDFRAADGSPLMDGDSDLKQPRDESGEASPVFFTRPKLKGDFTLAMKHHTLYTALLPTLAEFDHFKIIAVIRNPLDVIASWQRRKHLPLARGNPPSIARFWPEALAVAESPIGDIDRMVQLYELYLGRYHHVREKIHIVRYEDMTRDPMIISLLFDNKILPANAAQIKRRSRVHRAENTDLIRESLKKYGVFAREYYGEV